MNLREPRARWGAVQSFVSTPSATFAPDDDRPAPPARLQRPASLTSSPTSSSTPLNKIKLCDLAQCLLAARSRLPVALYRAPEVILGLQYEASFTWGYNSL
jgi:hypothetical protein